MLDTEMSLIEIMENREREIYRKNSSLYLRMEKHLVEHFCNWMTFTLVDDCIIGEGALPVAGECFLIRLKYSPFFPYRFDRIFVLNKNIKYHKAIHVYGDLSLCLYHPVLDKPLLKNTPLVKIIPWITEWCVNYIEWRKYKVWLGREIIH
jgi:hypothetical protein